MPLMKSGSKKALKHNIAVEMEAHPGKEHRAQDLAIAFSVQRQHKKKKMQKGGNPEIPSQMEDTAKRSAQYAADGNEAHLFVPMAADEADKRLRNYNEKKSYAEGGMVHGDQMPIKKENYKKLGTKYEGDNSVHPKGLESDIDEMSPPKKEFMGKRMPAFAKGGSIYGGKSEYDADEHPAGLESDNDQMQPSKDDFESNEWAGGTDLDGHDKAKGDSEKEYMANHMQMLADGGHVACMHCGGMGYDSEHDGATSEEHDIDADEDGHASIAEAILSKKKFAHGGEISTDEEEGPGTDQSYNIKAKKYFQEEGNTISPQPMDSNEHGHEISDEDAHDMVDMIRKKLKASRG